MRLSTFESINVDNRAKGYESMKVLTDVGVFHGQGYEHNQGTLTVSYVMNFLTSFVGNILETGRQVILCKFIKGEVPIISDVR